MKLTFASKPSNTREVNTRLTVTYKARKKKHCLAFGLYCNPFLHDIRKVTQLACICCYDIVFHNHCQFPVLLPWHMPCYRTEITNQQYQLHWQIWQMLHLAYEPCSHHFHNSRDVLTWCINLFCCPWSLGLCWGLIFVSCSIMTKENKTENAINSCNCCVKETCPEHKQCQTLNII